MSGRLLRGTESVRNHRRVPLRNNGIEFGGREYLYSIIEKKIRRNCQVLVDVSLLRPARRSRTFARVKPHYFTSNSRREACQAPMRIW